MTMETTSGQTVDRLPADSNKNAWSPAERALMQQLGLVDRTRRAQRNGQWQNVPAEDAPTGVIESFLVQARRTGLDPLNRQIYCIERGGQWGVQISIDGFRLIAERSEEYRGQTGGQWCGPDGVWRDVWLSEEPPAAARIGVYREGFSEPLYAVATWAGYVPRDRTGKENATNQWATNGSNQLLKCAEMLALRKAFPNDLSGLYGTEEMAASKPTAKDAKPTEEAQVERQAPVDDTPRPAVLAGPAKRHIKDAPPHIVEKVESLIERARAAETWEALRPVGVEVGQAGLGDVVLDEAGTTLIMLLQERRERLEADQTAADPETGEVVEGEAVEEPAAEESTPMALDIEGGAKS